MTRGRIQSIVRTSLAATLAMAWTLIGIVQMPLIQAAVELERLGPQIGQRVPDFSLPDQSGATGTVVSRSFEERYQERASANSLVDRLQDGSFAYEMDDGSVVRVRVSIDRESRSATVDFTGTSLQHAGNFNAPSAVCRAAALYVFRTLVDRDIPLNAGCLRPLTWSFPRGPC